MTRRSITRHEGSHAEATAAIEVGSGVHYQRLALSVVSGPNPGQRVEFADQVVRVGRMDGNELVIPDPKVSRLHVEIEIGRRGVHVRDPGSANGTRVNGVLVREAIVAPPARIEIAGTCLLLERAEGVETLSVPDPGRLGPLVGQSEVMRVVYARLRKLADSKVSVLIGGETGTGKDLAARALHELGRGDRPGRFIVVECGSLPGELVEAELFGYERGAFTGAVTGRPGAFEAAGGGTLLLDEIGDLPLDMQPKLLRVLDRREVRRVGSNEWIPVRARIIAAGHRDLSAMVAAGTFRSDLYYRLVVGRVSMPPLRERKDDIELLVEHFCDQLGVPRLPAAVIESFRRHSWPGNIRELRNAVERAAILGEARLADYSVQSRRSSRIEAELDLPYRDARDRLLHEFRRAYASRAVERASGNISAAARRCRIDRNTLTRMLGSRGRS